MTQKSRESSTDRGFPMLYLQVYPTSPFRLSCTQI